MIALRRLMNRHGLAAFYRRWLVLAAVSHCHQMATCSGPDWWDTSSRTWAPDCCELRLEAGQMWEQRPTGGDVGRTAYSRQLRWSLVRRPSGMSRALSASTISRHIKSRTIDPATSSDAFNRCSTSRRL